MVKKQLLGVLTNLGLGEYEAAVYLAMLTLGPSSVVKIAQAAEIKRTTVYSIIESLRINGLAVVHVKGFKKTFAAVDPENLEAMLESRRTLLQKALPELAALHNLKGAESTIKFYEGLKGIKMVYESLIKEIKPKEDYLVVSNGDQWLKLDPEFFLDFTKRRAKLNINIRLLLQDSQISRERQKNQKNINATIKILPGSATLDTNLVIIPNKVVIHRLRPPVMAIVIENQSVVHMHQQMFEIIWQSIQ